MSVDVDDSGATPAGGPRDHGVWYVPVAEGRGTVPGCGPGERGGDDAAAPGVVE